MNIIEFAENICNFHLSDWQKEYILNAYEAIKNNKQLFYIPPRGNSRFSFTLLQLIAIMAVAYERGLINHKEGGKVNE